MQDIFFNKTNLEKQKVLPLIKQGVYGCDDGELYLEHGLSQSVVLDDRRIKSANYDKSIGFGLRSVIDDKTAYAHSSDISLESLKKASLKVNSIRNGKTGKLDLTPFSKEKKLYTSSNPIEEVSFDKQVKILEEIDKYARSKNPLVTQVSASISSSWKIINIIRADASETFDIRPMTRISVSVSTTKNKRVETGSYGYGGRVGLKETLNQKDINHAVDEALRQSLVNQEAKEAPAGVMPVILGSGWPGVLLHEAVGHGLEGDFNRKETSVFSNKIGQKVASSCVSIVDEGNIKNKRGSISIDDEGTPSARNLLIENGILKGYMQDRLNARLMNMKPTGNGRRQSYAYEPMPRMTNTYMENGQYSLDEILSSVNDGIYATQFSGGQVDIVSGKFVFSANEAYEIKNGKINAPLKGVSLIGNGFDVMQNISMVGNDLALDKGVGVCGKAGQGVAVGVGQPSLKIDAITVGGTSF